MKKSLLAPALVAAMGLASTVASYGQGQISFKNYYTPTAPIITYADGPNAGLGVGPEIKAQLYYFIGSTSATFASMTPLSAAGQSPVPFGLGFATGPDVAGTGAGWFDGGTLFIAGSAGNPMTFAVAMFDGASWNDPANTYKNLNPANPVGPTTFAGATQSDSLSPIPNLPEGAWQNQQVFLQVPEPSSLALLGLGAAALAAFRRRQS